MLQINPMFWCQHKKHCRSQVYFSVFLKLNHRGFHLIHSLFWLARLLFLLDAYSWSRPGECLCLAYSRILAAARDFPAEVTMPVLTPGKTVWGMFLGQQQCPCYYPELSASFSFSENKIKQAQILLSGRNLVNSFTIKCHHSHQKRLSGDSYVELCLGINCSHCSEEPGLWLRPTGRANGIVKILVIRRLCWGTSSIKAIMLYIILCRFQNVNIYIFHLIVPKLC